MTPDETRLLNDVLTSGRDARNDSLHAGLTALRRRRVRRRALSATSLLLLPLALAAMLWQLEQGRRHVPVTAQAERVIPGTDIRVLSDDQLLDFFKGRPVALVGPPGDQRLIVFNEPAADHSRAE